MPWESEASLGAAADYCDAAETQADGRLQRVRPPRSGRMALGVCLHPCALPLLLLAQLGRERLAELLGVEDLTDLDLGFAAHRRALHPVDHLLERVRLDHPVAGDQLIRLRKGSTADHRRVRRESDAGTVGAVSYTHL